MGPRVLRLSESAPHHGMAAAAVFVAAGRASTAALAMAAAHIESLIGFAFPAFVYSSDNMPRGPPVAILKRMVTAALLRVKRLAARAEIAGTRGGSDTKVDAAGGGCGRSDDRDHN